MIGPDEKVGQLFERFVEECPKDHLEPHDWLQFFDFLIALHARGSGPFPEPLMTSELQSRGFDTDVVLELSRAFNSGLVLLRAYDRWRLYNQLPPETEGSP